jgi:hypothetical protein
MDQRRDVPRIIRLLVLRYWLHYIRIGHRERGRKLPLSLLASHLSNSLNNTHTFIKSMMIIHYTSLPYIQDDFPHREEYDLINEHLRMLDSIAAGAGDETAILKPKADKAANSGLQNLVPMEAEEEWSDDEDDAET